MRAVSDSARQSLRFIAAARYYLPVVLSTPAEWESQYVEFLHHNEFGLALETLIGIGSSHSGYAEEPLFWQECHLAAEHMNMQAESAQCRARLAELTKSL